MGKEDLPQSYAGRVGIALAVATLVITGINGIPAFLALRGQEPYVAYEVGRSQMLYPPDADRSAIRYLLREKGIPDAFATLSMSNRGDIAAKEVVVSLSVPGRIMAEETEPPPETKPAWVATFKEFDAEKDSSRIRYILKNVGLARTYLIKVSYISEPLGDARWEVFFDGKPAVLVDNLSSVPENAREVSFAPTLRILGLGLLLSLIAFWLIRNREKFPIFGGARVASTSPKWRTYKNRVVFELGRSELVTLFSTTNGSLDSLDPRGFWDAVLGVGNTRIALEVHTSEQNWPGIVGDPDDQKAYCLRVYAMAQASEPKLSYVFLINDEDMWSVAPGRNLVAMFAELSGPVRFAFLSGEPEEAAKQVLKLAGEGEA